MVVVVIVIMSVSHVDAMRKLLYMIIYVLYRYCTQDESVQSILSTYAAVCQRTIGGAQPIRQMRAMGLTEGGLMKQFLGTS